MKDWNKFWNDSGLYDKVIRRLLGASFTDDQADAIIDSMEDILEALTPPIV